MKVNVFSATCITNLHVGNGEVNYNIIDQEVEKDPVTGIPMINSSGVKGAIREFFESQWGMDDSRIKAYFGGANGSESVQGSYKFLQMDMLFRPLRVTDDSDKTYILATTAKVLKDYIEKIDMLSGKKDKDSVTCKGIDDLGIFDETPTNDEYTIEGESDGFTLKKLSGSWRTFTTDTVAIINNLNSYDLPVIARNVLDDNGISKNLWYEEFVPHKSVFSLIILTPEEMDNDFKEMLTKTPVQFGGNASIGYGLMDIKEVKENE